MDKQKGSAPAEAKKTTTKTSSSADAKQATQISNLQEAVAASDNGGMIPLQQSSSMHSPAVNQATNSLALDVKQNNSEVAALVEKSIQNISATTSRTLTFLRSYADFTIYPPGTQWLRKIFRPQVKNEEATRYLGFLQTAQNALTTRDYTAAQQAILNAQQLAKQGVTQDKDDLLHTEMRDIVMDLLGGCLQLMQNASSNQELLKITKERDQAKATAEKLAVQVSAKDKIISEKMAQISSMQKEKEETDKERIQERSEHEVFKEFFLALLEKTEPTLKEQYLDKLSKLPKSKPAAATKPANNKPVIKEDFPPRKVSQISDADGEKLLTAAKDGDIPQLKQLIQTYNFDHILEYRDPRNKFGAVNYAVANRRVECVSALNTLQSVPQLHDAIIKSRIDEIRTFLKGDKHHILIHALKSGDAAIHCAIGFGKFEVMQVMLEFKPNLEQRGYDGYTALLQYLSVIINRKDVNRNLMNYLSALIKAGADTNAVNSDGMSPLILACRANLLAAVKILIDNRAAVNLRVDCNNDSMKTNRSALDEATASDFPEVVEVLLKCNAEVNAQDRLTGATALHLAINNDCQHAAQVLLDYNARLDIVDNMGNTPIHLAALYNKPTMLSLLCENKGALAQLLLPNKEGLKPIELARRGQGQAEGEQKKVWDNIIKILTKFEQMAVIEEQQRKVSVAIEKLFEAPTTSAIEATPFEGIQANFIRLKLPGLENPYLLRLLSRHECQQLDTLDISVMQKLDRHLSQQTAPNNSQFIVGFFLPPSAFPNLQKSQLIKEMIDDRLAMITAHYERPGFPQASGKVTEMIEKFKTTLRIEEELVGHVTLSYQAPKASNGMVSQNNGWRYADGHKTIRQISIVFRQIALALKTMHGENTAPGKKEVPPDEDNFAHQDLNPGNVLVLQDDQHQISSVKLIDFGKAKKLDAKSKLIAAEITSNDLNSPHLLEACHNKIKVTPGIAEDYFEFAVLLAEVLTESRVTKEMIEAQLTEQGYILADDCVDSTLIAEYYVQYRNVWHELIIKNYEKIKKRIAQQQDELELFNSACKLIKDLMLAELPRMRERIDLLKTPFLHDAILYSDKLTKPKGANNSSKSANNSMLGRTTVPRLLIQRAPADGNCAFHSALGVPQANGQIVCQDSLKERGMLAEIIRKSATNKPFADETKNKMFRELIITAIQEMVMKDYVADGDRFSIENMPTLSAKYLSSHTSEQDWKRFSDVLHQPAYEEFREQINKSHPDGTQNISKIKFQKALHDTSWDIRKIMMTRYPDLYKAYLQYNKSTLENFDWGSNIEADDINAFANYIEQDRRWVTEAVVRMMALTKNITIHYWVADNSNPLAPKYISIGEFNPGQASQVTVVHNGIDHYDRAVPNPAYSMALVQNSNNGSGAPSSVVHNSPWPKAVPVARRKTRSRDGNSFFHAVLGIEKDGELVCDNIEEERRGIADAIRNINVKPFSEEARNLKFRELIIDALRKLIIRDYLQHEGFSVQKLAGIFWKFDEFIASASHNALWDNLYAAIQKEPKFHEMLRKRYPVKFDDDPKTDTLKKFQHSLIDPNWNVDEVIRDNYSSINTAFVQYNTQIHQALKWEDITAEYLTALADYVEAEAADMMSEILGMVALLKNITISYQINSEDSPFESSEPIIFNSGAKNRIIVVFDGKQFYQGTTEGLVRSFSKSPSSLSSSLGDGQPKPKESKANASSPIFK